MRSWVVFCIIITDTLLCQNAYCPFKLVTKAGFQQPGHHMYWYMGIGGCCKLPQSTTASIWNEKLDCLFYYYPNYNAQKPKLWKNDTCWEYWWVIPELKDVWNTKRSYVFLHDRRLAILLQLFYWADLWYSEFVLKALVVNISFNRWHMTAYSKLTAYCNDKWKRQADFMRLPYLLWGMIGEIPIYSWTLNCYMF